MKRAAPPSILVTVMLLVASLMADAQQPKIPRVGFLAVLPSQAIATRVEALRQGLRDLGYVDGQNVGFVWRYADGQIDRVPELAAELVRLKVDVIVTGGPAAIRPAKEATSTIPIVMAFDSDPVRLGFVASLSRPGGNVTGLSSLAPEISGKQLELLKDIVPKLSAVAVLGNSTEPGNTQALKELELAAGALAVQLQHLEVQDSKNIETAFQNAKKQQANALIVLRNPFTGTQRTRIVHLAANSRLPAIYSNAEFVNVGGLLYYGPNSTDLYRRAATYVDKILKGAKPADLPVEQPSKFEFIINLSAAKQIGLTIPPNVLVRADKVIK